MSFLDAIKSRLPTKPGSSNAEPPVEEYYKRALRTNINALNTPPDSDTISPSMSRLGGALSPPLRTASPRQKCVLTPCTPTRQGPVAALHLPPFHQATQTRC